MDKMSTAADHGSSPALRAQEEGKRYINTIDQLRPVGTEFDEFFPPWPNSNVIEGTTIRWRVIGHSESLVYGEHGPVAWTESVEAVEVRKHRVISSFMDINTGEVTYEYEDQPPNSGEGVTDSDR